MEVRETEQPSYWSRVSTVPISRKFLLAETDAKENLNGGQPNLLSCWHPHDLETVSRSRRSRDCFPWIILIHKNFVVQLGMQGLIKTMIRDIPDDKMEELPRDLLPVRTVVEVNSTEVGF